MSDELAPDFTACLPLLVWLSPAFPIGAFAYSHGLEWAVECGAVHDALSLCDWLDDLLAHGAIRNDAVLLAESFRAAEAQDYARVGAVNELALALSPSRERRLETATQGTAFIATVRAAWPCAALELLGSGETAYPVALGVAAAGHGTPLDATCEAFVLALAVNLLSVGLRLGSLGQTGAQKITATLLPAIRATAAFAAASTLDNLGGAALHSDIASMRHETQYSRLFRS
jgi:urease accessory protein